MYKYKLIKNKMLGKKDSEKTINLTEKQFDILLKSNDIINRLQFEINNEREKQNNYLSLIFDSNTIKDYTSVKINIDKKQIDYI